MNDLASLVFWHACRRKDVETIMQQGLLPLASRSSSKAVYLTDDRLTAENYANADSDEEWVVLEIPGSALDEASLWVDDYEFPDLLEGMADETMDDLGIPVLDDWRDHHWTTSLNTCNQVAYFSVIPSEHITVHPLHFQDVFAP